MSAVHPMLCPCGCDPVEEDQRNRRAMDNIRRNPRLAIQRLSVLPVNSVDLQALANLARLLPSIREEDGTALFIKFITKGYEKVKYVLDDQSITGAPQWAAPLMGLLNTAVAIKHGPPSEVDQRDIQQIRNAYKSIIDVIWHDLASWLRPGYQGDVIRNCIAQFLRICAEDNIGLKHSMLDQSTLSLVMHCWMYSSRGHRDHISLLVRDLLLESSDETMDMAVRVVTIEALVSKFREWLLDPQLVDEELALDLLALRPFMCCDRPFTKSFLAAKTYDSILVALLRERQLGKQADKYDVYFECDVLLLNIINRAEKSVDVFTDMLQAGLLNTVADITCIAAERNEQIPHIMQEMSHVLRCTNPGCDRKCTPQFMLACFGAFLPTYLPTLARLQATKNEKFIDLWTTLADDLGVTPEACRAYARDMRECSNAACPRRGEKGLGRLMKRCSRCREACYCSAECQKADWKFHKTHCQKTNAATTVA